jgi:hypothetical protein
MQTMRKINSYLFLFFISNLYQIETIDINRISTLLIKPLKTSKNKIVQYKYRSIAVLLTIAAIIAYKNKRVIQQNKTLFSATLATGSLLTYLVQSKSKPHAMEEEIKDMQENPYNTASTIKEEVDKSIMQSKNHQKAQQLEIYKNNLSNVISDILDNKNILYIKYTNFKFILLYNSNYSNTELDLKNIDINQKDIPTLYLQNIDIMTYLCLYKTLQFSNKKTAINQTTLIENIQQITAQEFNICLAFLKSEETLKKQLILLLQSLNLNEENEPNVFDEIIVYDRQ